MIYFTSINDLSNNGKFVKNVLSSPKPVWGITELSLSTFKRINKSDFILFYCSGKIFCSAEVIKKEVNDDLSLELFGSYQHHFKGELMWSNILWLKNVKRINIDFNFFKKICYYSDKYSIRRIIAMNENGQQFINQHYNSESEFISELKNYTQQNV
jgi:hydroxymethylpyrimidine pyrophosphatase-like HAD family hydrolase